MNMDITKIQNRSAFCHAELERLVFCMAEK